MSEAIATQKQSIFKYPVIYSFLGIIASIEFIRMALVLVLLPSFLPRIGYDQTVVGLVLTANLIIDNLMKSTAGWWVDRKGPWPVLLIGSIIVLLGTLMIMFFHQNIFILVGAAILIGLGVAPTWPGALTGSMQIAGEDKKATIISIISVVWFAGGGAGPILMGFLIKPSGTFLGDLKLFAESRAYEACFIILVAVALWAVITCVIGLINWRKVPHIQLQNNEKKVSHVEYLKAVKSQFGNIAGLIPGMIIQTLSIGLLLPNLLPYTIKQLHLTEAHYSILLSIGGVVVIATLIPAGHLIDCYKKRGFLVSGFVMAAGLLALLAFYGNPINIWWIVPLVGFSYSLIQPAWNSILAGSISPEQRGILMGLFMSLEGFGFAVGPLIGGQLARINMGTPFLISSILLAVMAVFYAFYPFKEGLCHKEE